MGTRRISKKKKEGGMDWISSARTEVRYNFNLTQIISDKVNDLRVSLNKKQILKKKKKKTHPPQKKPEKIYIVDRSISIVSLK